MKVVIAIGLAFGLLVAANAQTTKGPQAGDALEGTWKLTAGEANGQALLKTQLKDGKLVIKGERYTVTLADVGTITGTQKLNAGQQSKTIDIVDADGPNKGKRCLGIYEVKGEVFRVAFAAPGQARPKSFTTAPESGQWVHVWTRVNN
jgi:uncharacterized protein (TIGR03067 family)